MLVSLGAFTGLWLVAVAFLLGSAARAALVQTNLSERIQSVRVSDIMDAQPIAIPAGMPVTQAEDEFFLRYGWPWFPVVDERGIFIGIVRRERLEQAKDGGHGGLATASALENEPESGWRVGVESPSTELLRSEGLGHLGALAAVDSDGVLRGVVTADQVRRALQSAFGLGDVRRL